MLLSVIVDDLYVRRTFCRPDEANSPLLVDADAVLPFAIILQRLKAVARGHLQIIKNRRPVQLCELSEGRAFNVHPALDALAFEEGFGVFALEVLDRHGMR